MIGITPPVGGSGGGSVNGDVFTQGTLLIFKKPTNPTKGVLEVGDSIIGVVENTKILEGFYLGGDVLLKASFDIVQSTDFDI
ncbi:hypothetical protein ACI6PS_03605 [Flavobacterium sp. PLA-1-15]|uniref:hypothetical protein n=1 Tax=Flavobacterium sp. PLA-1-15 TaxID=3380533 RepID=UPI003B79F602